jgi:HSP20 family molecular chaperone IbpA
MVNGTYYVNDNGRISTGKIDDKNIDDILKNNAFSFADALEDLFLGTGSLANDFMRIAPHKTNRLSCNGAFPPSAKYVDPETKVLRIDIAACGVNEDEFAAEINDNQIEVQFGRKADKEKLYDYKGLKLVTDEKLSFAFDPRFHDPSTADCVLKNGILTITLQPREEVKPIKKLLGGKLQKIEEKKASDESTTLQD